MALSNAAVLDIHEAAWAGEPVSAIAKRFGTSTSAVSRIKLGQCYSDVTGQEPIHNPDWAARDAARVHLKLTAEQVLEIYRRAWAGENLRVLAEEFGVQRSHICLIKHGDSWAHITGHCR